MHRRCPGLKRKAVVDGGKREQSGPAEAEPYSEREREPGTGKVGKAGKVERIEKSGKVERTGETGGINTDKGDIIPTNKVNGIQGVRWD